MNKERVFNLQQIEGVGFIQSHSLAYRIWRHGGFLFDKERVFNLQQIEGVGFIQSHSLASRIWRHWVFLFVILIEFYK
jgi:hypothetical protein